MTLVMLLHGHMNSLVSIGKLVNLVAYKTTELIQAITKHYILVLVNVVNTHNMVYSNQMGKLPVQSNREHRLFMVYHEVDANYIDAEPMKDKRHNLF